VHYTNVFVDVQLGATEMSREGVEAGEVDANLARFGEVQEDYEQGSGFLSCEP
jgi:hypothetical protein